MRHRAPLTAPCPVEARHELQRFHRLPTCAVYGPQPSDDVPLWQRQQQQRWEQRGYPSELSAEDTGHACGANLHGSYTLEALRHPDQAAQDWIVVWHDAITAMHNPKTEDLGSWALLEWGSTEMYELCDSLDDPDTICGIEEALRLFVSPSHGSTA